MCSNYLGFYQLCYQSIICSHINIKNPKQQYKIFSCYDVERLPKLFNSWQKLGQNLETTRAGLYRRLGVPRVLFQTECKIFTPHPRRFEIEHRTGAAQSENVQAQQVRTSFGVFTKSEIKHHSLGVLYYDKSICNYFKSQYDILCVKHNDRNISGGKQWNH